jgi:hypothetical protein
MRPSPLPLLAAALLIAGCASAPPRLQSVHQPVDFTVFADGPQTEADAVRLQEALVRGNASAAPSAFQVHLGNLLPDSGGDVDAQYKRAVALFRQSSRVTFFVPGTREYSTPNSAIGRRTWARHFLSFDRAYKLALVVRRQPRRPENFAFTVNGVLFVGIARFAATAEAASDRGRRIADARHWLTSELAAYGPSVRAAVIFANSTAAGDDGALLNPLRTAFAEFAKPVLYLHAGGSHWQVKPAEWEPLVQRGVTGRGDGAMPAPVRVTVTLDPARPFRFAP